MVKAGDIVRFGDQLGQVVAVGGREWGEGWVTVKFGSETIELQESQVSVESNQLEAGVALTQDMIRMAAESAMNFGAARDMYDPESEQWLIRDGKVTEYGKTYFQKLRNLGII